jgi:thioredoxin-related protein
MNWLNPMKMYFWILLLLILLIAGGVYVYNKNISNLKYNGNKKNVPNAPGSGGDVRIMFFSVDWCPHCTKAKTPWEDFKIGYDQKMIRGRRIVCQDYNATESTTTNENSGLKDAKNLIDKYDVKGYPTIIMLKDGEKIEFDAKVTTFSLEKFIEDMV